MGEARCYVPRGRRSYTMHVLCKEAGDFTVSGVVLMTTHRVIATRILTTADLQGAVLLLRLRNRPWWFTYHHSALM
jgi:hypothetical protein